MSPRRRPESGRPPADRKHGGAQIPYIALITLAMLAFLAWLLFLWSTFLPGATALVYIFGTAAVCVVAALLSFAHR